MKYKIIILIKTTDEVLLENKIDYNYPLAAPFFAAEYTPINPKNRITKRVYRIKKHLIEGLTF
jgi:hypothetical protein